MRRLSGIFPLHGVVHKDRAGKYIIYISLPVNFIYRVAFHASYCA